MRVTERDIEILKAIHEFGCLTTLQVAVLFGMNLKVCQRRLRLMIKADYLRTVSLPTTSGRSPYLFYPGGRAESLLGVCGSRPRLTLQLTHQMKNTDILIGIINSLKSAGVKCGALPEHLIRSAGQSVIPDGAFMLEKNSNRALFLLENCAGTEIMRSPSNHLDVETKLIRYVETFEENNIGFYEDFFGCSFRRFRLLYVANDSRRFLSISSLIKDCDIHGFVCISTLSELKKSGVNSGIWNVPAKSKTGQTIV